MQNGARLIEGSVPATLAGLAGPMLLGILSVVLMNVIDTIFVSQLGPLALAALAYTFPVVTVFGTAAMGMGIGITSVLARAIGAGAHARVQRITTDALLLAVVASGIAAVIGHLTLTPLFSLLGADAQTLPLVRAYMSAWYLGAGFLIVPLTGNAALRAAGDVRTPAAALIGAAVLNVVLDPIFIFGLDLGVQGAAIATVLSRAVTMSLVLYALAARAKMLSTAIPTPRALLASWRAVLRVGAPAAATNAAGPVTVGVLTSLVAQHGQAAVAAYGAGSRAAMLALVPAVALGAAIGPLVGQSWGAQRPERISEALRLADRVSVVWGLLIWGVLATLHAPIAAAFTDEPAVAGLLVMYLMIAPAGVGLQGVTITTSAALNAIDRPLTASGLTLLRTPVLSIPLALLGDAALGAVGVFGGVAAAEVLTGLAARRLTRPLRHAGRLWAPALRKRSARLCEPLFSYPTEKL